LPWAQRVTSVPIMEQYRMMTQKFLSNRDRIRGVCAELFANSGYHATGIAEISSAVGLGRGALYHYIGSKETLLYEICGRQLAEMNATAAALALEEPDPTIRLRELARSLLRNIAEHKAEWSVFFREHGALTGARRDIIFAKRAEYEEQWRHAVDQAVRDGSFRPLPPLIIKGVLGMFNYSYLWLSIDGPSTPEQIADDFIDTLIEGMRKS
jgi:AcrR family transcriptional regulator